MSAARDWFPSSRAVAASAVTEDGKKPTVEQQDAWGQPLIDHATMPDMP